MPRNVELKARAGDPKRVRLLVERMCDGPPRIIAQEDTFFNVPQGRLKLRVFADGRGELIFYERDDSSGPKQSDYVVFPTDDPSGLKAVLEAALGVRAVVRKKRTLYMAGQTRIHLDQVDGLGCFLELEVVLAPGQSAEDGRRIAEALLERLKIGGDALVDCAYVDLLERKNGAKAAVRRPQKDAR